MRFLILSAMLVATAAHADCLGEAQMMPTTVKSIQRHVMGCRVFAANLDLSFNPMCPLDDTILLMDGIEVGMVNGHDCAYQVGDAISGTLVFNGEYVELN